MPKCHYVVPADTFCLREPYLTLKFYIFKLFYLSPLRNNTRTTYNSINQKLLIQPQTTNPMPETINLQTLHREILALKKDVGYIKQHITEEYLTEEEEAELEESLGELREGNASSLEDIEKDRKDA